jgi:OOP family OmpA-OmpF porin
MIRTRIFVLAALAFLAIHAPVHAANDDRQAVQDERGGIVRNTTGNCVRTMWEAEGDVCAPAEPPPPPKQVVVEAPPPPPPVKHTVISEAARTVYFPFNKTGLTEDAKQQLDTLAQTLKAAQDIQEAKVVGAADRIGSTGYNDKLSQKRAEGVRDYLIARGYTNASVTKTRWVGKSEPVTSCSKKLPHKKLVACLQGDRRVQIEIVYKTEVMTPAKASSTLVPPPAMPVMPPVR